MKKVLVSSKEIIKLKGKKLSIAYNIALPFGYILEVEESANAWWMDRQKTDRLILSLSLGSPIQEACDFAAITLRQYKYFVKIHPVFAEARPGFQARLNAIARSTIVRGIANDAKLAMRYMQNKRPEEFGSPSRRKKAF